ncbi:hypothetical protein [Streptomyces sp. NPDC127190]|uniref:hypothetical protein n=1 Tax=unclassified Streptomyces TaxID=2593676 RepID=UPI0036302101
MPLWRGRKITLARADGGHTGALVTWAKEKLQLTPQIVKRSDDMAGCVVLRDGGWWSEVRGGAFTAPGA